MIHNISTGETVYAQDGCRGIRLYAAHGNEYVYLTIDPGGGVAEHALPLAVSFCVLKGRGTCTLSGRSFSLTAGDMLECPADEPRGWLNGSGEPPEVLLVKRAVRP